MKPRTAITTCREILKKSGSSFGLAFNILPPEQKNAMTAFYAFCRRVDDVVDDAPDPETARSAISRWRQGIASIFEDRPRGPVCEALHWTVDRFGVRREHLELILDGVEWDLRIRRYPRFSNLYEYCYRVASAVGLVCITILGETSEETELYAELTGIAVQLTNILRDVGEDASAGRIYLPQEDLRAFCVREDDLASGRLTWNLKKLLRFEAVRAGHYYDIAAGALDERQRRRLFFPEALRETYRRLLDLLIEEDFPVFRKRVAIRKRDKLTIALKHRLHPGSFMGVPR